MNNYEQQAVDFLKETNTTLKVEFLENNYHFENDSTTRDIYTITIKRGNRKFSFKFGQSVTDSQKYIKDFKNGKRFVFSPSGFPLEGNLKLLNVQNYLNSFSMGERPKLVEGKKPTAYTILSCLQKYDAGSFEDFCNNFGYDTDSRSAKKTYKAVLEEYANVCKIWNDEEIEQLQEIN